MIVVAVIEYFIIALLVWGLTPTSNHSRRLLPEILSVAFWPLYLTWRVFDYYQDRFRRYLKYR